MFGTRVNDFCPRDLVIIEPGNTTFIESLDAYKNRWLFVTKETPRTKPPPSDAWEGGKLHPCSCIPEAKCDNGQIENSRYLGFSSPNFINKNLDLRKSEIFKQQLTFCIMSNTKILTTPVFDHLLLSPDVIILVEN